GGAVADSGIHAAVASSSRACHELFPEPIRPICRGPKLVMILHPGVINSSLRTMKFSQKERNVVDNGLRAATMTAISADHRSDPQGQGPSADGPVPRGRGDANTSSASPNHSNSLAVQISR